jgi:FMN phosphatase YigB (HAD superfamily)
MKSLFTGVIARSRLPSRAAETLLEDYRAGFPDACALFPDAAETLSCLRTSGLKLGLITSGSIRMQSRKLQGLALSARTRSRLRECVLDPSSGTRAMSILA